MVLTAVEQVELSNAKVIEQLLLHERIKSNGLVAELQKEVHYIAGIAANEFKAGIASEEKYMSVISMVYTVVEEGRLNELYEAIQKAFPEYYL